MGKLSLITEITEEWEAEQFGQFLANFFILDQLPGQLEGAQAQLLLPLHQQNSNKNLTKSLNIFQSQKQL